MKKKKLLAIDLGASSGRGIEGSFDGEKLTLSEIHRFSNDPVMAAGVFQWDILRIFHEIQQAIRQCVLSGEEFVSIGIDTWGVDFGLIGKDGSLLSNPVHYRDARTAGMQQAADAVFPKQRIYELTGTQFMDFNTLFQLLALQRKNPGLLEIADRMLFTPDLLNYFLTGQMRTEYTIASTSQLLDARARDWSVPLREAFGFSAELFAPIVQPGASLGSLLPQIQQMTGQTDAKVVNVASHDTASSVVSVPATEKDFVFISSGTWSLMGSELDEPLINNASAQYEFTNEGGYGGKIRLLRNIMGLWLEQESRRQYKREGKDYSFNQLSEMAMAAKPLQSLIDPDDPSFVAPGDMPRRICDFCEKTGQHVPQDPGEVVRCIFESLALRYRMTVERLDMLRQRPSRAIHIVGGGTKEAPLCQMAADACGIPVYAGPVEATAIGNLAVQAIAAGELSGLWQAREMIRRSFAVQTYEPCASRSMWDEAYGRFCKLLQQKTV